MARNLPQLTLKATGKLNKHSLNHLKDTLELQRNLYNSSLGWLAHRPGSDFRVLRDSFRKDLTSLRRESNPVSTTKKIKYSESISQSTKANTER